MRRMTGFEVCLLHRIALTNRVHIFYDLRCAAYGRPGHPERPDRLLRTVPFLKERHADWHWREPRAASDQELLRAHSPDPLAPLRPTNPAFRRDPPPYPHRSSN